MEQELAIKTKRRPDKIPDTSPEYQIRQFCVVRLVIIPYFSRCSIASRILTGTHQQPRSRLFSVKPIFIIDLDPQAFSRRLPWHPQGRQPQQTPRPAPCPPPPPSSALACERLLSDNSWTRSDAVYPLLILPSSSVEPQAEPSWPQD